MGRSPTSDSNRNQRGLNRKRGAQETTPSFRDDSGKSGERLPISSDAPKSKSTMMISSTFSSNAQPKDAIDKDMLGSSVCGRRVGVRRSNKDEEDAPGTARYSGRVDAFAELPPRTPWRMGANEKKTEPLYPVVKSLKPAEHESS